MKFLSPLMLFLLRLVRSAAEDCYSNTADIYFGEQAISNTDETRVYTLCANTTYTFENDYAMPAIFIRKPNVKIQCGETGKSEGNCIFQGTEDAVRFFHISNTYGIPLTNIVIEGLTFTGLSKTASAILIRSAGDVLVNDCKFTDNTLESSVSIIEVFTDNSLLEVNNAIFENNTAGNLISAEGTENVQLKITNSKFNNNEVKASNGAIIRHICSDNGMIDITSSCFSGNAIHFAPIVTDMGSAITETDSFAGDNTYLSSECRGVSRIFTPNTIPFESSCEIMALSGQSCDLDLLEEPSSASSSSSDVGMIAGISVGATAAAAGIALFFKKKQYSVMSKGRSNREADIWIEHGVKHKYLLS